MKKGKEGKEQGQQAFSMHTLCRITVLSRLQTLLRTQLGCCKCPSTAN